MNDLLISVTGGEGAGKTTVLMLIISALADAGLLSAPHTKHATERPEAFFAHTRLTNLATIEAIEIEICPDALLQIVTDKRRA